MPKGLNILFLCTGNSCRSQMVEGWARYFKSDQLNVASAGIEKHGLNPLAVKAMAEAGVDILTHHYKTLDELPAREFDYVITVCGHANETCPAFMGNKKTVHVGFDDPPRLAENATSEAQAMVHYRRVRDEIRAFVEKLPNELIKNVKSSL